MLQFWVAVVILFSPHSHNKVETIVIPAPFVSKETCISFTKNLLSKRNNKNFQFSCHTVFMEVDKESENQ